jgi:glutathione synthase/RimK-type ligase-like ATP-grasp enzyme
MGLCPAWLIMPGGPFVITTQAGEKYINAEFSTLNSQLSASLSKNKNLTRIILGRHGLPNIPFARPKTLQQAELFLIEHGTIVVKPLKGMGSRDIHIVTNMGQLAGLDITKYIFEKYIAGKEMRYLVLNGNVIAVHQSEYGTSVESTRVLQRISYCKDDWDAGLDAMSVGIATIFKLGFTAIDYLIDAAGRVYVLEVNSAPGLKWFHAPSEGPPVDVAQLFMDALMISDKA